METEKNPQEREPYLGEGGGEVRFLQEGKNLNLCKPLTRRGFCRYSQKTGTEAALSLRKGGRRSTSQALNRGCSRTFPEKGPYTSDEISEKGTEDSAYLGQRGREG